MGIGDTVQSWLFGRAIKKAAMTLAQAITSYVVSNQIGAAISINPDALAAVFLAGSEVARNYLKVKFPKVCGWL